MSGNQRTRWTLTALLGVAAKCVLPGCATEPVQPGSDAAWFEAVRWEHRLLVITGNDERSEAQCRAFKIEAAGMLERDLIVVDASVDPGTVVVGAREDIPPARLFRERFDLPEGSFQVILVGKDGRTKERRDEQFDPEDVFRIIDAMPMRIQEMDERGTSTR